VSPGKWPFKDAIFISFTLFLNIFNSSKFTNLTNYQLLWQCMSLHYKHCNKTKHLECLPKHPSGQFKLLKCFPSSPLYELQMWRCLLVLVNLLTMICLTFEFFMEMHQPTFHFSRFVSHVWHELDILFKIISSTLTHPQSPPPYS
jgi:hypothetical protein